MTILKEIYDTIKGRLNMAYAFNDDKSKNDLSDIVRTSDITDVVRTADITDVVRTSDMYTGSSKADSIIYDSGYSSPHLMFTWPTIGASMGSLLSGTFTAPEDGYFAWYFCKGYIDSGTWSEGPLIEAILNLQTADDKIIINLLKEVGTTNPPYNYLSSNCIFMKKGMKIDANIMGGSWQNGWTFAREDWWFRFVPLAKNAS